MTEPEGYRILREPLGHGIANVNGIAVEVYREKLTVEVDGRALHAKLEVPVHKGGVNFTALREQEAWNAMQVMAMNVSEALSKIHKVKAFKGPKGEIAHFIVEDKSAGLPELVGVERILVRGLAYTIKNQHPKWTRQQILRTMALARMGKGPYGPEWMRMCARGPSENDADAATAGG